MILVISGGSETIIPAAKVCEQRGVPCLSTGTSWNT
jgi:hypothetical protein